MFEGWSDHLRADLGNWFEPQEVSMARRSLQHRRSIPGYDDRPSRAERARDHRRVRHLTHQILATATDPEELEPLPEVRRRRLDTDERDLPIPETRRRFRVWKTPFWKRRDHYREMRASLDARWAEVAASEEEDW